MQPETFRLTRSRSKSGGESAGAEPPAAARAASREARVARRRGPGAGGTKAAKVEGGETGDSATAKVEGGRTGGVETPEAPLPPTAGKGATTAATATGAADSAPDEGSPGASKDRAEGREDPKARKAKAGGEGPKAKKAKPLSEPSAGTARNLEALRRRATRIATILDELHPDPVVPLLHGDIFQLLCAVLMSAQTTDVSVNKVSPELFALAPDASSMARLDPLRLQNIIRTVGLAATKSRNLVAMSRILEERHGGLVPKTFEELEALPGVGHKTASVVLQQGYGLPAFPVDTHIHRLAERWGLSNGKSVEVTEADLKLCFPDQDTWRKIHMQIIFFGRSHCPAKRHDPKACPICSWAGKEED